MAFNLDKNYAEFVGSTFRSKKMLFELTEAYQRNAFVLDEYGAEVESEASIAAEAVEEYERPKPKMMIFNKPFVLFLKRRDAQNPYFGIYNVNAELLKKS